MNEDELTQEFETLYGQNPNLNGQDDLLEVPSNIGRYRVDRILGRGGFGIVYLGMDLQLERPVAIKVPYPRMIANPEHVRSYLREAQVVASLDHRYIVPVYDIGTTEEHPCFVVSKFIDGESLSRKLSAGLGLQPTTRLIAKVARGLHYAHKQGVVHRDIKPGNILVDANGEPWIVDFGLALKDIHLGQGPQFAGTPTYMSPEQARREGHRVDGRSDIFSLGIVLYVALTGRKPFQATSIHELLDQIVRYDPRPVRQYDEKIPRELERICAKAMAKRASERYTTAHDMAEDLDQFLAQLEVEPSVGSHTVKDNRSDALVRTDESLPGLPTGSITVSQQDSGILNTRVLPRGLRSFDSRDTDFFLELLPGPRDRNGLPDSLRFWIERIQEPDPDKTFSVGLIYGPSGCGKSSWVRAGLLPLLNEGVIPIYLNATPNDTETLLAHQLQKHVSGLAGLSLKEMFAAIRQGRGVPDGMKILIVADQFEQWLYANTADRSELVDAFRQCDGGRLQTVLLVRDDFWMAATRLMRQLEVSLVEGENSAAIDLFDQRHAEKVLAAFGRAFDAIEGSGTAENKEFIRRAVDGMADEGKVVCVRLALFAEMMKAKPWTPDELARVGGTRGVGVSFLEETFNTRTSPPKHRYHEKAARSVLTSLLPDLGTEIKGQMKSLPELEGSSGYSAGSDDFSELIHLLDRELRLITPTDPNGVSADINDSQDLESATTWNFYQLTHDYLVPSLRTWLTQKQQETRVGRAELQLEEQTKLWATKKQNRNLPTLMEYLSFRWFTNSDGYSEQKSKLMRQATIYHGRRILIACVMVLLASIAFSWFYLSGKEQRLQRAASNQIRSLLAAETVDVDVEINKLNELRVDCSEELKSLFLKEKEQSRAKLHAALAMSVRKDMADAEGLSSYLEERLVELGAAEFMVICSRLNERSKQEYPFLEAVFSDVRRDSSVRFRAACGLAQLNPESGIWRKPETLSFVADYLVGVEPTDLTTWRNVLRPVGQRLVKDLTGIFEDDRYESQQRLFSSSILADYCSGSPSRLFALLKRSQPNQFPALFAKLENENSEAVRLSLDELALTKQRGGLEYAAGRANVYLLLLMLGRVDSALQLDSFTRLLNEQDVAVVNEVVRRIKPLRLNGGMFASEFVRASKWQHQLILVQCLGEFEWAEFTDDDQQALLRKCAQVLMFAENQNSVLDSWTRWLVNHWGLEERFEITPTDSFDFRSLAGDLKQEGIPFINTPLGQKFIGIRIDSFEMGSPDDEPNRDKDEVRHQRTVNRLVAVLANELTWADWRACLDDLPSLKSAGPEYQLQPGAPMVGVTWVQAAQYCNWLSEKAKLPQDQWCYELTRGQTGEVVVKIPDNVLLRTGFRLPTEAEWEFICRSGELGVRSFGSNEDLMERFAWFKLNSNGRPKEVSLKRPNQFGFFDTLGNAWEWCHDPFEGPYLNDDSEASLNDVSKGGVVGSSPRVIRGGGFNNREDVLRSANRFSGPPNEALNFDVGFRPVCTVRVYDN